MKKHIITSVILAAMVIGTSSALAADTEPMVIGATIPEEGFSASELLIGVPQITVGGETVDLSKTNLSQYIFAENGNTMVPLRVVAEKWDIP